MKSLPDFVLGLIFLGLGLGYLYRPDIISRLNSFLRKTIFNDAYLNLERKKWGIFFLLLSLFFLYISLGG